MMTISQAIRAKINVKHDLWIGKCMVYICSLRHSNKNSQEVFNLYFVFVRKMQWNLKRLLSLYKWSVVSCLSCHVMRAGTWVQSMCVCSRDSREGACVDMLFIPSVTALSCPPVCLPVCLCPLHCPSACLSAFRLLHLSFCHSLPSASLSHKI